MADCTLSIEDIHRLATGAWILGAGGGGDPYHSYLNMRELYRGGVEVKLIEPPTLADNAQIAVVSAMGAPLVGEERLDDPVIAARAVQTMEEYLGRKFDAVMAVEIGGSNGLQPFLVAAIMDIPVVDADAMGRAFPEAQMTSFAIGDLQPFPMALADIRDNTVVLTRSASWKWTERISRVVCTEMGSTAATCKAPRTGKEVKQWGLHNTVSQAIRIGRTVEEANAKHVDPIQAVLDIEQGLRLFTGKVSDITRRTTGGFLRGTAEVDGLEADRGARFRLEFQNEFLIGVRDGDVQVMVPEIICVMDSTTGEAIGTETLRYGQRVTVVALPSPALLLSEAGLRLVGPRAFDYDIDFRSVFGADDE